MHAEYLLSQIHSFGQTADIVLLGSTAKAKIEDTSEMPRE